MDRWVPLYAASPTRAAGQMLVCLMASSRLPVRDNQKKKKNTLSANGDQQ